jgi:hypothetical protein
MQFEVPARISGATPDSARLARVKKTFAASASPVRPLPSNGAMMLLCAGVFVVLAILLTIPVGFPGFAKMSVSGRWMDYSVVFLLTMVMAGGVVEQMIPGSRRTMRPVWTIFFGILLLSVTAVFLFPDFAMQRFVPTGIPCLRYGLVCAIPGAGFTWILMRFGFVTDPVPAAVSAGALSGLLGAAVLALHCSIFNAPHIVVWHVGVIVVASLSGVLTGRIIALK